MVVRITCDLQTKHQTNDINTEDIYTQTHRYHHDFSDRRTCNLGPSPTIGLNNLKTWVYKHESTWVIETNYKQTVNEQKM